MKRSTKLALSLVLAAGTVAPAFAQDNFPDVPANHWAYEALARMKRDGLLVGYPDGLYRGGRPASRYELAVAMHAVYTNLKNVTDGLDAQIRALQNPGTTQADIAALKDAVAALQADLAAMKGYGDDIAALKRAADVFDRELKSLGVDVESMKKDLVDLSSRVGALEKKKPAIDITGDVNLLVYASNANGNIPGLSQDGRYTGLRPGGYSPGGITDTASVLHEAAFTFTSTNPVGPKFTGTAVVGNLFQNQGGQSVLPIGSYTDATDDDIYIQNLQATFGITVLRTGLDVTIGRIQTKTEDPYLFRRIDNTSYFSNERWDNGKYAIDGGETNFKFLGAKIGAFAGRTSQRFSTNGLDVNQVVLGNNRVAGNSVGTFEGDLVGSGGLGTSDETPNTSGFSNIGGGNSFSDVDRVLGLQAAFPLTKVGNINLAYLWMDSDDTTGSLGGVNAGIFNNAGANRVEVYGGDADFTFGRIKLSGSLNQSNLNHNDSRIVDGHNLAFDTKVGYQGKRFDLYGKYREIGTNFIAPGDWGRLGILRNPAGIRGFQFGGSLNIGSLLVLSASGETDTGLNSGNEVFGTGTVGQPFDADTKIDNYAIRVDYKLSPNASVFGSYEDTRFSHLAGGLGVDANGDSVGTSKYRFATFGVGYGLSATAKLNVSYQYSDIGNEAFLPANPVSGVTYKGGLLTTQLTLKF